MKRRSRAHEASGIEADNRKAKRWGFRWHSIEPGSAMLGNSGCQIDVAPEAAKCQILLLCLTFPFLQLLQNIHFLTSFSTAVTLFLVVSTVLSMNLNLLVYVFTFSSISSNLRLRDEMVSSCALTVLPNSAAD